MRRSVKALSFGMLIALFLVCSRSIQTQGATWENFSSMYEYTELEHNIYYQNGEIRSESTYENSLKIWNVTVSNDKVFFRTNFTPYFMGWIHFETQEEYDTYLAEHYWYDNETDSMSLAYSVVGTDFYLVDMLDSTITYNATIVEFDPRMVSLKMWGMLLPVNHSSFSFKTEFTTRLLTEYSIGNVKFEQRNTFVIDEMEYEGYHLSLEYTYKLFIPEVEKYEYKVEAMYSLLGELYQYKRLITTYCGDDIELSSKYEDSLTLDPKYRINGTEVSWVNPIITISSLLVVACVYIRFKRVRKVF